MWGIDMRSSFFRQVHLPPNSLLPNTVLMLIGLPTLFTLDPDVSALATRQRYYIQHPERGPPKILWERGMFLLVVVVVGWSALFSHDEVGVSHGWIYLLVGGGGGAIALELGMILPSLQGVRATRYKNTCVLSRKHFV